MQFKNMNRNLVRILIVSISIFAMFPYGCKKDREDDQLQNSPPKIQSIISTPGNSSDSRLIAGDQATIVVNAIDPDQDNMTYTWETDNGSFMGETNSESVTWNSPVVSSDTTFKVTAIVSDGAASSSKEISIYIDGVTVSNLKGYVYYEGTTIPISDVQITVNTSTATTGDDGYYEMNIPAGNQIFKASKEGYGNFSTNLELTPGTHDFNIEMTSTSFTHKLSGIISSKSNGAGIPNCRVAILNPDGTDSQLFTYTSLNGFYEIPAVPEGNRNLRITEKCHFETQIVISSYNYQYNTEFETEVTDPRNGRTYNVVEVGGKVWMAENLNYGTRIDGFRTQADNQVVEKYCYGDNESNCNTYGGLYQWDEMMQYEDTPGIQGICMDGWHLPTNDEWTSLIDYLGGRDVAGGKLKEKGTVHWKSPNTGATNQSGFSALAGGARMDGHFYYLREYGLFWTSTEDSWFGGAWAIQIGNDISGVYQYGDGNEFYGRSVRCVRTNDAKSIKYR